MIVNDFGELCEDVYRSNIEDSINAKRKLLSDESFLHDFKEAASTIVETYQQGGRLYVAGNGGSAADAQHLVAEFVSKLARDRAPIPAEALTTDTSILTAIGNDYGYEFVFSRQLQAKLTKNDVFLGITTSGNSKNIIEAIKVCKEKGIKSIILTGHDGGLVKSLADVTLIAPGIKTSTIQEVHIILEHTLCELVERALFSD